MQFADITTIPAAMAALKIWILGTMAFVLAMLWTPALTHFLYKYKIGVRIKKTSVDGEKAPIYYRLHKDKSGIPSMGGVLVWVTVIFMAFALHYITPFFSAKLIRRLDFLSRSQTWLPFFALVTTAVVGAFDDIFSVRGWGTNKGGGIRFLYRFGWLLVIAIVGSWWFYINWDMISSIFPESAISKSTGGICHFLFSWFSRLPSLQMKLMALMD